LASYKAAAARAGIADEQAQWAFATQMVARTNGQLKLLRSGAEVDDQTVRARLRGQPVEFVLNEAERAALAVYREQYVARGGRVATVTGRLTVDVRQGALRTNYSARQGIDASQYWRARLEQRLGEQPSALRAGTEFVAERAGVAPASARPQERPVGQWSVGERLAYAVREAASRLGPEVGAKLKALATPENITLMVGTLVALAATQGVPVVNVVVDAVVVGMSLHALGQDVVEVVSDLVGFASKVLGAQSEEDLQAAGEHLARAVAVVGVDTVAAVLVHRTVKVVRGGAEPPSGAVELVTPEGVRVRVVGEPTPRSAAEPLRSNSAKEGGGTPAGAEATTPSGASVSPRTGQVSIEPGRTLTPAEQRFAAKMAAEGRQVRARAEVNQQDVKNPDFEIDGEVVEFKYVSNLAGKDAERLSKGLCGRILDGRSQAAKIVVDVTDQPGMTKEIAERAIKRAFGQLSRILKEGHAVGEIEVRIYGRDFDVSVKFDPRYNPAAQ